MSSLKPDKFRKALMKKGFESVKSTKHERYVYYHNGVKTEVFTEVSHGSHGKKDMGDGLVSKVTRQMKFDSRSQLFEFVECSLSKEEYFNILTKKGYISTS